MVNELIIPNHNYTERELSVVEVLKNNNLELKTFLNVGFHDWDDVRRHWWIKICEANNIDWKILEIHEKNVINAINKGCPKDKIILGDILNVNTYDDVDCLLFWHGPEHVDKDIFLKSLEKIENKVNKLIIFGMPLGFEPQGAAYGNEHEIHISEWNTDEWKILGYEVIEIHDRVKYPHITTFKKLENNDRI